MVSLLVSLVVWLIVLGLIYWAMHRLAALFGISAQIIGVLDVVLVVVAVLMLVSLLLGGGPLSYLRLH